LIVSVAGESCQSGIHPARATVLSGARDRCAPGDDAVRSGHPLWGSGLDSR